MAAKFVARIRAGGRFVAASFLDFADAVAERPRTAAAILLVETFLLGGFGMARWLGV